jgi:hypothetical protein
LESSMVSSSRWSGRWDDSVFAMFNEPWHHPSSDPLSQRIQAELEVEVLEAGARYALG